LAYQGRNDIDDIIPSSHRSSDLDGHKPNLVISLFALQGIGRDEFNIWYQSEDNRLLAHWQRRIASSDVILEANQLVDYWLLQADQLVYTLPIQLQKVARGLVLSVKKKTTGENQGRIA
jgi:octaprenyl-diphosphate synthase